MTSKGAFKAFVITALLLAIVPFIAVLSTEQLQLHDSIVSHHAPWADEFFAFATHVADGWVAVAVAVALLFMGTWRSFLLLACSTLGSSIVVQSLKHGPFDAYDRPFEYIAAMPHVHLVPGVEVLHHNSFPSGHSTFAFSFCFALAIVLRRRSRAVALAVLAGLLAFSRVYLSQHFTEDVLAGAFVGTICGSGAYYWLYVSSFSQRHFLDRTPIMRKRDRPK